MGRRTWSWKLEVVKVVVAAIFLQAAYAQNGLSGYPALTITLTDEGLEVQDVIEEGFYRIVLNDQRTTTGAENSADEEAAEVTINRLQEGTTAEEAIELYRGVDAAYAGEGNPGEAIEQLAQEIAVISGSSVHTPEATVFELTPGDYMASLFSEPYLYKAFSVTDAGEADAPQADLTVDMLDFAFSIPDEVPAGEQTWEVQNVGDQIHHMILMRINEGATLDDVMAFLETEEGEPPAQEIGFTSILSPGVSNYMTFDLEPGNYFVVCFLPDYETGMPHVALGMIDTFTVAGD